MDLKYFCIFLISIRTILTECLWSTYRPGPYFGLRSILTNSPLFGIIWYYPDKMYSVKNMRHFMEISDDIKKYEWVFHNGCNYGKLIIEDPEMFIKFEISYFNEFNINEGNHWVVRINGNQIITNFNDNKGIVFIWYISNSNNNTSGENKNGINYSQSDNNISISGEYFINSKNSTKFYIKTIDDIRNQHPTFNNITYDNEFNLVLNIPEERLYDPSEYIIGELKDSVGTVPNHLIDSKDSYRGIGVNKGNVFVQQKFYKGEFLLDIHYYDNKILIDKMNINKTTEILKNNFDEFNIKFTKIFEKDYNRYKDDLIMDKYKTTAISAMSTLCSNLLFMEGNLQILDLDKNSVKLSKHLELLTVGPDKTSHSRGFMWDEGFQQMLLSHWNLDLSLKIVSNWFKNVDIESGWLAREQSLDNESRSRAPPSSWASIPNVSNPPSLILFIDQLFQRKINSKILLKFLKEIIENLEKNADWYINYQQSQYDYVFAWKGKTDDFCLPSGLDDYPRCKLNGKSLIEGHIDLQSWMITMSRTLIKVFKFINQDKFSDKIKKWSDIHNKIFDNILNLFWDNSNSKFDDFYIDENDKRIFCGHSGYLQLFPLILNIFDSNDSIYKFSYYNKNIDFDKYIKASLKYILNPEYGLRTPFGIRSLSIYDDNYKKEKNYWTSPIWINVNYLIIKTLHDLKSIPEYSFLKPEYNTIRQNLVNNMVRIFQQNGFIWEVYDDITGDGKYNHPFTGWSALIVNLIYEMY